MKEKIVIQEAPGKKTPTHLFIKVDKRILKNIPDAFYVDLTIDDIRDAEKKSI
jgi:hypothetical protein